MIRKRNSWGKQEKIRSKKRLKYFLEYRKKHKGNTTEYNRKRRKLLLDLLGNKCVKCGFSDWRALQVDHINGGGTEERKKTSATYWNVIIRSIKNKENKYQLLCANCNFIKRYENNEI